MNVQMKPLNYTPVYSGNNPMAQIIGKLGSNLKPMGQATKALPYETFANPYRETLNSWEKTFARPEFENFTANPWERAYGNNLATTGASLLGSAKKRYADAKNQAWQPYHNRVMEAQNQIEEMIRNFYNTNITNQYDSPTAFRA